MNGRVDILGTTVNSGQQKIYESRRTEGRGAPFFLHDKIPVQSNTNYFNNVLRGMWEPNKLSMIFFSSENILIVQNGIRSGVYEKSDGHFLIGPQDLDTLLIIMRSVYLQHSANKPNHIAQQISELNKIVLDYSIPQILGEAKGYIKYKQDISTLPTPMSRPSYMSMAGINTYKMKDPFGETECTKIDDLKFQRFEDTTQGNRGTKNTGNMWEQGNIQKKREKEITNIFKYQKKFGLNTECFGKLCTTNLPREDKILVSEYKGVTWDPRQQMWMASIKIDAGGGQKEHKLGYFSNEWDAALRYDQSVREYKGANQDVNFEKIQYDDKDKLVQISYKDREHY
jgi:hypothetical protein